MGVRKIEIVPPSATVLSINGNEFTVRVSDFEALELILKLHDEISSIGKGDVKKTVCVVKKALELTDTVLGKGAAAKIMDGNKPNINFMIDGVVIPILDAVIKEGAQSYSEMIEERYE